MLNLLERNNYLATVRRTNPRWIPIRLVMSGASRKEGGAELEEVMARHPLLFPDFQQGQIDWASYVFNTNYTQEGTFTDNWGVVWQAEIDGLAGLVLQPPLEDWAALETWAPPDPLLLADTAPADWAARKQDAVDTLARGQVVIGGVAHGFFLMRLWYLRGFENLMVDLATDDPHLPTLIEMVIEHNLTIVRKWLEIGVDQMDFPEDLGTQDRSIISPRLFHKWVTPAYTRIVEPAKQAGVIVHQHSDGYIMELIDDLVEAGRDVINLQDLCNGIQNIKEHLKGRVCIDLDIDRQKIVPFGTRQDIRDLIEEEVRTLGSPQGGLMLICGIYPPTPPENVDALCNALEEFYTYWW